MGVGRRGVITKEMLAFSAKVSKFTSRDFFYRAFIQMDKAVDLTLTRQIEGNI